MTNRIRQIEVRNHSLVPAEAEVWIGVTTEQQTPTTELRGRLMGPSCAYAETVEVAYPLRSLPPPTLPSPNLGEGRVGGEMAALTKRAVIPEACLWEPECPFLYRGAIELWQDGQCCDRATFCHGLRSFQLGERGLYVNGRPLILHGRSAMDCSDEDAWKLRQAGGNLLVVPVSESTMPVWERADRLGFLVLGRVVSEDEATRQRLERLSRHASCLGWLVDEGEHPPFSLLPRTGLVGLACASLPRDSSLALAHFLFGPAELANLGRPLLVKGELPSGAPTRAAILGRVE